MARVQRIESDSAFNSANVLDGTILTYKTFQDGRVVHKAKLSNGSVVEITPEVDFSLYYTSEQVDQLLEDLSNSIDLSNYYTKAQIDAFLSDSSGTQTAQTVTESFSSVDTSNYYTLQHKGVPFGVVTGSGKYYPVEKFSVELELSSTRLKVTPYMAYQNMSAFTGTWKVIYTKLD